MATEKNETDNVNTLITAHIDWKAYLAGLTFAAALAAGGAFIQQEAATGNLLQNYKGLFVSLLIGSSAGHYYGKALENQRGNLISAYLGVFTLLFAYWIYQNQISLLSAVLILMTVSLILGHDAGLIANNGNLKHLVDVFAGGLSPIGIVIFSALKFIGPAVPFDPVVATIVNSLTQEVTMMSAEINVVVFAIGLIIGIPIMLAILAILLGEG